MADQKLTALTAVTTLDDEDLVYVVIDPSTTPASRKIRKDNLWNTIAIFLDHFALGDEDTDLTVGTAKITWNQPNFATTLLEVEAYVKTAPTGSGITVDVNEGGTSVLSTKITIDATETSSATAATQPVISDSALAANAIMTADVDVIGSTIAGSGLKLRIKYKRA